MAGAGGAIIGALRVVLGADTADFEKGLKSAQASLASFGAGAGKALAVAGAAMSAAAIGLGVAIKSTINEADKLGKMSQKVGVPVEELSALRYAADLADVSLEALGKGLGKLSKTMVEAAAKPTSEAANAFRALGISVLDSDGKLKSSSQVMSDVAEKFAGLKDGAGKTAVSMALFGKAGAELIPLLNGGKKGLEDAAAAAARFGIVLGKQTTDDAQAFNDNLKDLGYVFSGLVIKLTAEMLPSLKNLSATMVVAANNSSLMKGAADLLVGSFQGLVNVALTGSLMMQRLSAEWKAFRELLQTDIFSGKLTENWEKYNAVSAESARQLEALRTTLATANLKDAFGGIATGTAVAIQSQKEFNYAAMGGKNALDQFIASQQKSIAGQQAELQTIGMAAGAKEALKVTLQGLQVATDANLAPNEAMRAKLAEVSAAAGDMALKIQGAQLVQANLEPGLAFRTEMENNRLAMVAVGATSEQLALQAGKDAEKFGMSWSAIGSNIAGTAGALSQLTGTFAKENKAMGIASKAFGIGQAIINTQIAITKALATLPPPASYVAVALAIAQGAAAVASISAQKFAMGGAFRVPGGVGGGDRVKAMLDLEPGELVEISSNRPGGYSSDNRRGDGFQSGGMTTVYIDAALRPLAEALFPHINAAVRDGHELKLAPA